MHHKRDDGTAEQKERRLDLSVPQVAGSALAAVAAAVLASRLGVYGTILGAGLVGVVATCGGSLFQHLFRRTGEQIRDVTQQARPNGPRLSAGSPEPEPPASGGPPGCGEFGEATTRGTRVRGRKRSALAAAVVFVVAMLGITGYELASGQDLAGGRGTTVGTAVRGGGGDPAGSGAPAPPGPRHDGNGEGHPGGDRGTGSGTDGGSSGGRDGDGTAGDRRPGSGSDPGSHPGSGTGPGADGGDGDRPAPGSSESTGEESPAAPQDPTPSAPSVPAPSSSTGATAPDSP